MKYKICVLFLVFLTMISVVSGATYYISASGSDTTGDGSSGNPWQSFNKVCTTSLGSNHLVIIKNGTYYNQSFSCTTNANLTLRGESFGGVTAMINNSYWALNKNTNFENIVFNCSVGTPSIGVIWMNGGGSNGENLTFNSCKIAFKEHTSYTSGGISFNNIYGTVEQFYGLTDIFNVNRYFNNTNIIVSNYLLIDSRTSWDGYLIYFNNSDITNGSLMIGINHRGSAIMNSVINNSGIHINNVSYPYLNTNTYITPTIWIYGRDFDINNSFFNNSYIKQLNFHSLSDNITLRNFLFNSTSASVKAYVNGSNIMFNNATIHNYLNSQDNYNDIFYFGDGYVYNNISIINSYIKGYGNNQFVIDIQDVYGLNISNNNFDINNTLTGNELGKDGCSNVLIHNNTYISSGQSTGYVFAVGLDSISSRDTICDDVSIYNNTVKVPNNPIHTLFCGSVNNCTINNNRVSGGAMCYIFKGTNNSEGYNNYCRNFTTLGIYAKGDVNSYYHNDTFYDDLTSSVIKFHGAGSSDELYSYGGVFSIGEWNHINSSFDANPLIIASDNSSATVLDVNSYRLTVSEPLSYLNVNYTISLSGDISSQVVTLIDGQNETTVFNANSYSDRGFISLYKNSTGVINYSEYSYVVSQYGQSTTGVFNLISPYIITIPTFAEELSGVYDVKFAVFAAFGLFALITIISSAFVIFKIFESGADTSILLITTVGIIGLGVVLIVGYIIISIVANSIV